MKLPLLLSVPHAGLLVPPEVADRCMLDEAEIIRDGDEGAAEIYRPLEAEVAAFVTTEVARAIVDINRAENDRRKDGIVKTHTCWDVPIYKEPLSDELAEGLIATYHRPYHQRMAELAQRQDVRFGVDCHTMAAHGPPVGPDPGVERPLLCLGNAHGESCSETLFETLASCLEGSFEIGVARNAPFAGGYNIRAHAPELPWVQLEMSRTPRLSHDAKRTRLLAALRAFCSKAL